MIYSFDIFDTVIGRQVPTPGDIFKLLQAEIPKDFPGKFAREFFTIRRSSESNARHQAALSRQVEDILLGEIYDLIEKENGLTPGQRQWLQDREFALELEKTRPIPENIQRIHDLRAAGERVIFISDMYLGAVLIRRMLEKASAELLEVPIYVSGDIGLLKYTGHLFTYVMEKEGIAPDQLIHRGDNPHHDRDVPARLGIHTDFYVK